MSINLARKILIWLVPVVLFAGAQYALADTIDVEFYTTGIFNSTGTNTLTLGSGNGANQLDVIFNDAASSESPILIQNPDTGSQTTMGTFEVAWRKNADSAVLSDTFTLTIHQFLPGEGTDTITGLVMGTIEIDSNGNAGINFNEGFS